MTTAAQRAFHAQVALYGLITAPFIESRDNIAEALRSVVSTAQLAEGQTGGIAISHGHKSQPDQDSAEWTDLEKSVWAKVHASSTPGDIWETMEVQMTHIGVKVSALADVRTAHDSEKDKRAA